MPPVKINRQIVELSSCLFLLLVGLCVLSVPSLRQGAKQCLIIESERISEREEREKGGDRETETKRWREKNTEGGGSGEIERELRPVEIHHNVRNTDTLQPQIHHHNRVCRHNWMQETSEVEKRCGERTGQERRGKRKKTNWLLQLAKIWPKAPVWVCSTPKANKATNSNISTIWHSSYKLIKNCH